MPDHAASFPAGFLWGAATAAYQIEGSPLADGAGPNIWHYFSHTRGRVANGDTGDIACDHYHRFETDIAIMRELGLTSYRFSIAWARLFPDGRGPLNRAGLAFYERLVDALLAANIQPLVTLYHWDLPAELDLLGGWLNPDIADWFGEYARAAVHALGDRIPMWVTLNEPWVIMDGGYLHGVHAPGHASPFEAAIVGHNLLRAHGTAVQACRAQGAKSVGLVVNLEPKYPATQNEADVIVARRAAAYMNGFFLDPVFLGEYPAELRGVFGEAWREPSAADMALIRQPIDFLGINYYHHSVVSAGEDGFTNAVRVRQPQLVHTEMDWEVFPDGLTDVLVGTTTRYGRMPLYVTENGAAFHDPPTAADGIIRDPLRTAYLRDHLVATRRAIAKGADVRGYFAWSLLDNFEWSLGYSKRFGIVHVDFATQQRTIKESGRFYASVIRNNGADLSL